MRVRIRKGTTAGGRRRYIRRMGDDGMTREQKRRDQLLRAEKSTESDAAPRITVSDHDGVTRIDIADTAAVRPGPGPGAEDGHPPTTEGESS